ncbi:hypothetical protein [Myxococcus sp. NMCA1]|uniref:hypothetical protein n=1 Tax=Myxococcus sp. NMCA1 TaxID=2996785 RepID=UPI0022861288|nr:hypothetical protein [Myxococcus sp. NMCA1]WAM23813.1 hypothetical protein OZ403_25060 [Myxococcus sp. NMCA1]
MMTDNAPTDVQAQPTPNFDPRFTNDATALAPYPCARCGETIPQLRRAHTSWADRSKYICELCASDESTSLQIAHRLIEKYGTILFTERTLRPEWIPEDAPPIHGLRKFTQLQVDRALRRIKAGEGTESDRQLVHTSAMEKLPTAVGRPKKRR